MQRLTWDVSNSLRPAIADNTGSGVHVVWEDDKSGQSEIYYKRSVNNGVNWLARVRMTWNPGFSWMPTIATDSGTGIHVAWNDDSPGNLEIFYKKSTDSGATWSALKRLTWNSGGSGAPCITADSGQGIHLVWYDNSSGNREIYYRKSTNSGNTWSALTRLTWNSGESKFPVIAADSGSGIHLVWYDTSPGNFEIFYKRSTDSGASWSALKRITWNSGPSAASYITTDSGTAVYIIWTDSTLGNYDIFYKKSTNNGSSWLGTARLTWNTGHSDDPSITINPISGIHVVWYDETPGNYEIYYKNGK
jgi:hypothetical protein